MKILFDTNLWISFMIGKRLASLADVLCRHDVEVYVCEQQLDEIRGVIAREKFDRLISAETRYYFFEMIYDVCRFTDITVEAKSDIRDPKDLYLLSMAESVPVDYIVSGDRDLTDMKQHAGIPILKYTELIDKLNTNR
ncbi:MAG: putative toxin-antitoxin system toxin component, PIN family [Bacteroidaceae bacterium]|nr:putative toxin-antitoxin system toxin component, PIN family [Bacteroidaceae bacterium]